LCFQIALTSSHSQGGTIVSHIEGRAAIAWRNAHRNWFEAYEYLRCLKALPTLTEPVKLSLLRNLASYSRLSLEAYSRIIESCGLSQEARQDLVQEFEMRHHGTR
jgi:hypothetical protein